MHKLRKTLSKILAVACLFIASFNVNAMDGAQDHENPMAMRGNLTAEMQGDSSNPQNGNAVVQDKNRCCHGKAFNVVCGVTSLLFLAYTNNNVAIGGTGFLFFTLFTILADV